MRTLMCRFFTSLILIVACGRAGGSQEDVPWAVQLGNRIAAVERAFPIIDRVVLVPDARTYLDELSRWSPAGRWPVLIEDDHFAPLFVRAFKPKQLIRRPSVQTDDSSDNVTLAELQAVVIRAFGGQPETDDIAGVFERQKFEPAGVVVTSLRDEAWTAAVALAAGRGQPIGLVDESFGTPGGTLSNAVSRRCRNAIHSAAQETGFTFGELGEKLETITVCREMAGKMRVELPARQQLNTTAAQKHGPIATTDFLCRLENGDRFGFAGWIWGDAAQCAYMAMSSLFLSRDDVLLYNSYQESGQWSVFSMQKTVEVLEQLEFTVEDVVGTDATPRAWQQMIRHGLSHDVMLMNTKGNADWFELRGGPVDCLDVPLLDRPLALHMVHSWSLTAPATPGTLGHRWLRNGVYAYVGSAHEPFLPAFVPPDAVAKRSVSGSPFLISARHWGGQFAVPWRVQTIGDPLMLWISPSMEVRRRVEGPYDGPGESLREALPDLMRDGAADPSGSALVEAFALLRMFGEDSVAASLWGNVADGGVSPGAARAAMPSLFRVGDRQGLLDAFLLLERRDPRAEDMVWHSWQTLSPRTLQETALTVLLGAIREDWPHTDIRRLIPAIEAAYGKDRVRLEIDRWRARDLPENRLKALDSLRQAYR